MKKREKVIIGALLVYIIFMIGYFIFMSNKKEDSYSTMFYDNYVKLLYKDGKWSNISISDIDDYSWKKYDLYYNNDFYHYFYIIPYTFT